MKKTMSYIMFVIATLGVGFSVVDPSYFTGAGLFAIASAVLLYSEKEA